MSGFVNDIGVKINKKDIVACHRLERTDRRIVTYLNRKDAETVFPKMKKLKDIGISKTASDLLPDSSSIATDNDNDSRNVTYAREKRLFISQTLCPYYCCVYGLVKEKKTESIIYGLWVSNGTIHVIELQDSRVIDITHESDI